MKQNLRMASIPSSERKPEDLSILTLEDVKHFTVEGSQRPTLGFRFGAQ